MKNIIFNIEGMHCKSCEMLLQDELKDLSFVKKATASTEKGQVFVEFKWAKTAEDEIKKAIKKAGFKIKGQRR